MFRDSANHIQVVIAITISRVFSHCIVGIENECLFTIYHQECTGVISRTFSTIHPLSFAQIFGPVQSIFKFDTMAEVIEMANNTEYGLAAAVHTKDIVRALTVSNSVRAGTVWSVFLLVLTVPIPYQSP